MFNPGVGGYVSYPQMSGTQNNQFATTYTPADQSQTPYGVPGSNVPQQNQYPAPYTQGNTYNQSNIQGGMMYPPNGYYQQGLPSQTPGGEYSNAPPPYNADGSVSSSNEPSYKQAPPPSFNPGPPFQRPPAPQGAYNQTGPPLYNQAPPPSYTENSGCQQANNYPQNYSQGASYDQQGPAYPQQNPTYSQQYPQDQPYMPKEPTYPPGGNHYPGNTASYQPAAGPKRPPKRPHMPQKLQTSFKQAKKTAAIPPQPITKMQPFQGGRSAASSIHDLAQQNGYSINWFEVSETGPPHAKVFSMKVTMGPYEVTGSGRSKKLAKQDAAQLLMAQVQGNTVADLIGLPGFAGNVISGQTGNTSEEYGPQLPPSQKMGPTPNAGGENPVSMLDHVTKKYRLGEPQYITVCENGSTALQRFEIKVKLNDMECSGLGRSKKVAKKNAAQVMLDQLSRSQANIKAPKQRITFVKASSETSFQNKSVYENQTASNDSETVAVQSDTVSHQNEANLSESHGDISYQSENGIRTGVENVSN